MVNKNTINISEKQLEIIIRYLILEEKTLVKEMFYSKYNLTKFKKQIIKKNLNEPYFFFIWDLIGRNYNKLLPEERKNVDTLYNKLSQKLSGNVLKIENYLNDRIELAKKYE